MKIVLASMTVKPEVVERVSAAGGGCINVIDSEAVAATALGDADAFILSDNAYTEGIAAAVRGANKLKWVQVLTAGYDNITRIGIPSNLTVTSVGDAFSPSVAVHAATLLLALQRGIPAALAFQQTGEWSKSLASRMVMPEGKTLLICGFGSIGQEVARLLAPFGMHVIGISRSGAPHPLAKEVHKTEALLSQLPRADAIVLSMPLSPATAGLFDARAFAVCRPHALLVNVSRGKLIDQTALADALKAGKLGGAGLDVTDPEPLPPGHPLWSAPNIIISPHVAGAAGPYGTERQIERASDNLRRYLAGEPVRHRVTP